LFTPLTPLAKGGIRQENPPFTQGGIREEKSPWLRGNKRFIKVPSYISCLLREARAVNKG
jgi:hypothetical protein